MWKPLVLACVLVAGSAATALSHDVQDPATLQKPNIRDLLSTSLESADGLEVIVSHVALPANVTLPMHWHPGEEFAYILQGSVTLILEDEGEHEAFAGDVGVVPLKKVHTARSGKEGATILVFRVHEAGEPGRILVGD